MSTIILRPEARWLSGELIVFKHSKELGDCPAYKLFDAVEVQKKENVIYPRNYTDYSVAIHEDRIPGHCGDIKEDMMEYSEDDYLMLSGIQHYAFAGGSGRSFI